MPRRKRSRADAYTDPSPTLAQRIKTVYSGLYKRKRKPKQKG